MLKGRSGEEYGGGLRGTYGDNFFQAWFQFCVYTGGIDLLGSISVKFFLYKLDFLRFLVELVLAIIGLEIELL